MRLPTDPPPFVETKERQRTATLLDLRTCKAQHFSASLKRQSQQELEAAYVKFYVQYHAYERQKKKSKEPAATVGLGASGAAAEGGAVGRAAKRARKGGVGLGLCSGITFDTDSSNPDGFDLSSSDEDEPRVAHEKTESDFIEEDTKAATVEFRHVFKNWVKLKVPWRLLFPEENLPEGDLVSASRFLPSPLFFCPSAF